MGSKKYWAVTGALGCVTLLLLVAVIAIPLVIVPWEIRVALKSNGAPVAATTPESLSSAPVVAPATTGQVPSLSALYRTVSPGIVSIQVYARRGVFVSQGAGSGFVYDDQGHIVTNNHVVQGAQQVTVIFADGQEANATVVGTDPDSDLAVVKVDQVPEGVHALPLGDSDQVAVGDSVIAIGNPFGLQSSMTAGIVSAVGRTIDSGATPYAIPEAIQTDAAINPGNSGGPLLNLQGQVIGVNAQIATNGVEANAGVGFAIPSNIVHQVIPELLDKGSYTWPWLGVSGGSVNLAILQANGLENQQGAYIDEVTPDSPASRAGLRGSTGTKILDGAEVPAGGDVVVAIDGQPITSFDALLVRVAAKQPGDQIVLTVLRGGQQQDITVTLAPRPNL